MYRILNPMNNNVSLVRNSKGEELIVVGKGISFGKKKGDLISEDQVEKVFRMKTEESRENFMTLLKDVPLDFITITYEIIDNLGFDTVQAGVDQALQAKKNIIVLCSSDDEYATLAPEAKKALGDKAI